MALRNRHAKNSSLRPQLQIEVLEQRYVLSANMGLAPLTGAASVSGDNAASENAAVVGSELIAECTIAITPSGEITDNSGASEKSDAACISPNDGQNTEPTGVVTPVGAGENSAAPAVVTGEAQPVSCGTASSPGDNGDGSDGLVVAPVKDVAPKCDDGSQPARDQINVDELTLSVHILENSLATTGNQQSTDDTTDPGSADATTTGPDGPIVCTFGGINESNTDGEVTSPSTLHPTNGGTDDSVSETANDTPVHPIYYSLGSTNDPASNATGAALRRKDVKHIAREIKRGHDVDLDVDALMQLHSATKKNTRTLIERIIVTTHETNHAPTNSLSAASGNVQAIDQAFAGLGAAAAKVKSFKRHR
jgi:hypothetical protein